MVNRLRIVLEQAEYSALLKVAQAELRSPEDQLRHILRAELERRGLVALVQADTRATKIGEAADE